MEQEQFKVRISVSTKLILLIGFLLITSIFFLNLSAIKLFSNDKRAYVFDNQATTAALAGKEFTTYIHSCVNTLRLMIGYSSSSASTGSETLSAQEQNNINFFLQNQRNIIGAKLYKIEAQTFNSKLIYEHFLKSELEKLSIDPSFVLFEESNFQTAREQLSKTGIYFKNLSGDNLPPLLAVVFADPAQISKVGFFYASVGFINLIHFSEGLGKSFSQFVITDNLGEVLFHSNFQEMVKKTTFKNEPIFKEAHTSAFNSGAIEFYSTEGTRTLGSYFKPGFNLTVLTLLDYNKAMQATYKLSEKFMMLALATLGFMTILGLIFSKRLVYPIKNLFQATTEVSAGNFNVDLPVTSNDEIGALTKSFISMSKKILELIHQMVDKVRLDQELEIARTVQQTLFPPTEIQNENIHICSHYQSASECGGDWWGYFVNGKKHILIIADATGHGLPSALMTATMRSCFSVIEKLVLESNTQLTTSQILALANRSVHEGAQGKIMMTCFVGIIDFDSHLIQYSSAGHNPPWLLSTSESGATKINALISSGPRLGEARNLETDYEIKESPFTSGSTLVLYTDGLLEGTNLEKEQFGKKRARTILEASAQSAPQELIHNLMTEFLEFNGPKPLDDDITLAIAKLL